MNKKNQRTTEDVIFDLVEDVIEGGIKIAKPIALIIKEGLDTDKIEQIFEIAEGTTEKVIQDAIDVINSTKVTEPREEEVKREPIVEGIAKALDKKRTKVSLEKSIVGCEKELNSLKDAMDNELRKINYIGTPPWHSDFLQDKESETLCNINRMGLDVKRLQFHSFNAREVDIETIEVYFSPSPKTIRYLKENKVILDNERLILNLKKKDVIREKEDTIKGFVRDLCLKQLDKNIRKSLIEVINSWDLI